MRADHGPRCEWSSVIAVVADKPKGPSLNRTLNQSCRGADCLVGGDVSDGVSRRCRGPARRACRDDPWRFTAGVVSPRVSLCASAAGWVQMRCRECAAEVAVTARVCSGCGAPIVGQPPVVADAVVGHTVVGAVSDAAGKAVPAGVAEQALPEPYVPGSGDRVPVELRLVLAGYVGIAAGLFATALACATAFAFHFRLDGPVYGLLFSLAVGAFFWGGCGGGYGWGCSGRSRYPIFQAASAAQRSTHGHGDGLEAWRTHADT